MGARHRIGTKNRCRKSLIQKSLNIFHLLTVPYKTVISIGLLLSSKNKKIRQNLNPKILNMGKLS